MSTTRTASPNPSCLTPRETDVVKELAQGHTYREIAAKLGIGYETVKMHIDNMRRKLQMRSRTRIAVWWHTNERRRSNAGVCFASHV